MEQSADFLAESRALNKLVSRVSETQLLTPTGFKGWTIEDVIRHLHVWNQAAGMSLMQPDAFGAWVQQLTGAIGSGGDIREGERALPDMPSGAALVSAWNDGAEDVAGAFATADPSMRLAWVGPSMSARSSITARLMETWAHGQEVYDVMGVVRQNEDRIRNIVVLGVNTYGWSFKVRGQEPPAAMPHLNLTGPSGAVWTYGDDASPDRIEGLAEEFCQVVTQTRNVADTRLAVTGPTAKIWMENAQCFAGGPVQPPAPGARRPAELPEF